MTWTNAYWDALTQLYWTPKYLGLRSIPAAQLGDNPEFIQISRDRLKGGRALYVREGVAASNLKAVRKLEETLNHLFDLTLALLPDQLVSRLFYEQTGITDLGPFKSWGRELAPRLWGKGNVTQHDAFLTSSRSILGMELKLGSATSSKQVFQYLALMHLEERHSGRRERLGLLFITPRSADQIWSEAGLGAEPRIERNFFDHLSRQSLNPALHRILRDRRVELEDLTSRVQLAHLSWSELSAALAREADRLSLTTPEAQTLWKLLLGFKSAIDEHDGT